MIKTQLQVALWMVCVIVLGFIFCFFASIQDPSPKSNFEQLLKTSQYKRDQNHPGIIFSRNFDTFHELEKVLHVEDEDEILSQLNCSNIPFISLIVFSSPRNVQQRAAIRGTWASNKNSIFGTKFFIGLNGLKRSLVDKLREEQSIHEDLLFGEFVDSYDNLSVKAMTMLKWMNRKTKRGASLNCSNPQYLMKVDDDTFLNMDEVVNLLTTLRHKPLGLGSVITGAELTPWNAYTEAIKYPDYLSGSAYILSAKGVEEILKVADDIKPFWLEDVYVTGFLAERAGVPLLNSHKFQPFTSQFDPCSGQISSHKIPPKKMAMLHNILFNSEKYCRFVQNNNK